MPAPLPFLALGDSYTLGEGVPPAGRWTHQLAARLRAEGLPLAAPHTVAQTGWTTDELAAALDAADAAGLGAEAPFALVSLLAGVNDQYRGRPLAAFEAGFALLLRRAVAYAGGEARRVLVLGIPDWG
ncbi:MAG: SGNH/GDSL hydrolase family protein, partial [Rubricoccaceae bacterium]